MDSSDSLAGLKQKVERHRGLAADPSAEDIERWRKILDLRNHGGLSGAHFNDCLSPRHFNASGCVTSDEIFFERVVRCAWLAAVEGLGQRKADDLAAGVAAFSLRGHTATEADMVSRAALRWAARTLREASAKLPGRRRVLALVASVLLDALFHWPGSDSRVEQVKAALLAGKAAFESVGLSGAYSELMLVGFMGRHLTESTFADLEAAVSSVFSGASTLTGEALRLSGLTPKSRAIMTTLVDKARAAKNTKGARGKTRGQRVRVGRSAWEALRGGLGGHAALIRKEVLAGTTQHPKQLALEWHGPLDVTFETDAD